MTQPYEAPPQPPQVQTPVPPPSSSPWWKRKWGIAAIVVVGILILGGIGSAMKPKADDTGSAPSSSATAVVETEAPAEATPTDAVQPSESTPEVTPEPADTPEPAEPTTEPTPTPPTDAIIKTSGKGDKVVKVPAQDEPTIARITAKGSGNFAVVSYTGADYGDLLVNEIGSYKGSVYVEAGINRLQVTSSGSWTIDVLPVGAAPVWDGTSKLTGSGDSVIELTGSAAGITTITNKSKSNFAVIAYTVDGDYLDLLVNEIGNYDGEVLLPDEDPMLLSVHAVGGKWSMSAVEQ